MIARAVTERLRLTVGEACDNHCTIPESLERRKHARKFELATDTLGQPVFVHHSIRMVNNAQATYWFCRSFLRCRERRHHCVKQRQGDGGPYAAEYRAARDGLFRHYHDRDLLNWNGVLFTMREND